MLSKPRRARPSYAGDRRRERALRPAVLPWRADRLLRRRLAARPRPHRHCAAGAPAAGMRVPGTQRRPCRTDAARTRSTAARCGSGSCPAQTAAAWRRSSPRRTGTASATLIIKSSDGTSLLVAVHAAAGVGSARQRPQGLRLAVRVRQRAGHRGLHGRRRRPRRRRLPDDRRRGRVRGQVRLRADLHAAAAEPDRLRAIRSRWPASPTSTTTRRSPTRCSSARAAPSTTRRRCTGGTSAPPLTPCSPTPTPTTSSTSARSSRWARSTATRRRTRSSGSASCPAPTERPA